MKFWKKNLVPILFAIGGVFSLVPAMKSLIKGEPLNETFLVLAINYFVLAVVFFAVGRKSGNRSGPPNTSKGTVRDEQ